MLILAHDPPATPYDQTMRAGLAVADDLLGWVRLGPDMMARYVVLKRSLFPDASCQVGYWAGPDDPDRYYDCLAVLNMRTPGRLNYAQVATFATPHAAWSTWNRWRGQTLGHGWVVDFRCLGRIADWTRIPPITLDPPRGRQADGTAGGELR